MNTRIPYTKPSITDLEIDYVNDAIRHGWGENCYDYIHQFESVFKSNLGVKYAIATSSCTGALHMGMAALGIGPGDEVIMADTNWIATASPITMLGAKPVFVDILPDSWCIDPGKAEEAITPRTKAIIAVHLYGNLCDMEQLLSLSQKYNLPLIEDAAEAIGSSYFGKPAGSMADFGTFSFHGTKTITTGEGGMFVTNNPDLYEHVLTLSNHGRARGETKQFWSEKIGFKYKMSNVQAALGCAQMERIDQLIQRKRQIFLYYREQFSGLADITVNPEPDGTINGYWMPTVVFSEKSGIKINQIQSAFYAESIDARVFFWPISSLPMFTSHQKNPLAQNIQIRSINLPSYHDITFSEQDRVIKVITKLLSKRAGS